MHLIRSAVSNDAYFHAVALHMDWPIIPTMTVFIGILTVCAGISIIVLVYRGLDWGARLGLVMCILAMCSGTVVYWALTLSSYSLHVSNAANSITGGGNNVVSPEIPRDQSPASAEDTQPLVVGISSDLAMGPEDFQMCTGTVALVINITLGDGIVWWRAWAVCARKRWVFYLAVSFLVGLLALGVTEAAEACSSISPLQISVGSTTLIDAVGGGLFIGNTLGFVSSIVTLLTNVIATSLIGHQAWVHSRMIRDCHLNTFPSRVGVRAVLALLVESGVLYCIVWAWVVAFQATLAAASLNSQVAASLATQSAYVVFSWFLVQAALVPLVAIYPTVIIILVTLGNSCFEVASTPDGVAALPLFAPQGESTVLSESAVARIDGAVDSSAPTPTRSPYSG